MTSFSPTGSFSIQSFDRKYVKICLILKNLVEFERISKSQARNKLTHTQQVFQTAIWFLTSSVVKISRVSDRPHPIVRYLYGGNI